MKTFFVIVTFCLTGVLAELTAEERADIEASEAVCMKETGVTRERIRKLDEEDEQLACFMACTMKKIGMMNADGSINDEVYNAKAKVRGGIPKDKAKEILEKCRVAKGNNACQTAMKVVKCIYDEDNKF